MPIIPFEQISCSENQHYLINVVFFFFFMVVPLLIDQFILAVNLKTFCELLVDLSLTFLSRYISTRLDKDIAHAKFAIFNQEQKQTVFRREKQGNKSKLCLKMKFLKSSGEGYARMTSLFKMFFFA